MKTLTLINPYYMNPQMLVVQYQTWSSYPEFIKQRLEVIVVDDGSPEYPAVEVPRPDDLPPFSLYRILVDVRWNWLACRNLAAHFAVGDWLLLTDIDHVIPKSTLDWFFHSKLDRNCVYRLSRRDAPDLTPYKPHPNTWLMTTAMFWKVGGYDERFSGYYGTDGEFRDRVKATADKVLLMEDQYAIRYPREVVSDASTTTYGRKEPQDGEAVPRIRKERNLEKGWRPRVMSFPWERLV